MDVDDGYHFVERPCVLIGAKCHKKVELIANLCQGR